MCPFPARFSTTRLGTEEVQNEFGKRRNTAGEGEQFARQ